MQRRILSSMPEALSQLPEREAAQLSSRLIGFHDLIGLYAEVQGLRIRVDELESSNPRLMTDARKR